MIERRFPDPLAQQHHCVDPLGPYVDGFAEQLAGQGYTAATTKEKLRLITHLNRWLERHDLSLPTLDEERVEQFLADRGPSQVRRGDARTCRMLLDYLRELGTIPPPTEVVDNTPLGRIESGFRHYLVAERGLSTATVINYSPTVHRFLEERFGAGEAKLNELSAPDVHRFLLRQAPRVSRGRAKLMATALRRCATPKPVWLRWPRFSWRISTATPSISQKTLTVLSRSLSCSRPVCRTCC